MQHFSHLFFFFFFFFFFFLIDDVVLTENLSTLRPGFQMKKKYYFLCSLIKLKVLVLKMCCGDIIKRDGTNCPVSQGEGVRNGAKGKK